MPEQVKRIESLFNVQHLQPLASQKQLPDEFGFDLTGRVLRCNPGQGRRPVLHDAAVDPLVVHQGHVLENNQLLSLRHPFPGASDVVTVTVTI